MIQIQRVQFGALCKSSKRLVMNELVITQVESLQLDGKECTP